MSLKTSEYKHIAINDEGQPVVAEMPRLKVRDLVMSHQAHGWSADELVWQFQGLTPAQAHGALSYYYDHQDEIDAAIREVEEWDQEWDEQHKDDPLVQKLAKFKASRQR